MFSCSFQPVLIVNTTIEKPERFAAKQCLSVHYVLNRVPRIGQNASAHSLAHAKCAFIGTALLRRKIVNSIVKYWYTDWNSLVCADSLTKKVSKRILKSADKGASALNEPVSISVVCVGFLASFPALPTAFLHGSAPACVFCLYCNRIFLQDSAKIAIFGEKSKCGKFLKYRRNIHSNRVCLNNVFYYIYVF